MKAINLHSLARARNLIKPSLLIAASILAITAGTTAYASPGYNGVSSISLGFTFSPGGHRYYQPYRQPRHYVRYNNYYPESYSHYRPLRRHGYRYRKVHHNEYDD